MVGKEPESFRAPRVLTDVVSSFSPPELSGQRSRHSCNTKNVGARSVGARPELELSRTAHLKDSKLIRLEIRYSQRNRFENPK